MNCPRGHGRLLLRNQYGERSCLNCGYVWYPAVIDPEEAKQEQEFGSAVRRPTRREQLL